VRDNNSELLRLLSCLSGRAVHLEVAFTSGLGVATTTEASAASSPTSSIAPALVRLRMVIAQHLFKVIIVQLEFKSRG
jgi:hypothetical protein